MSSKQDLNGVRTAQDLERKYDLKSIVGVKKAVEKNEISLTKMNNELENFIVETVEDISNLQSQIDGNITTYFYSGEPTLENLPASEWTETEYNNHIGDLYYDKDTGYSYRFTLDSETNIYSWLKLIDSDVTEALAIANAAQDTADSKRRVFVTIPTIPYDVGDIWIREDQDLYRCFRARDEGDFDASDFMIATKYTDDTVANRALAVANDTKNTLETNYVTNTVLETTKDSINGSIQRLAITVDDKNKVYTTQPEPPYSIGDVYALNDKIYVCETPRAAGQIYDESDWVLNIDTAVLVNETTFNATTDSINAQVSQLATNTTNNTQKIASLGVDINEIKAEIGEIADMTISAEGTGTLYLEHINESAPIKLVIYPTVEDFDYLYPSEDLYPSENLYPVSRKIVFSTEDYLIKYEIPSALYYYNGVYDEFILDYENSECYVIHKIGIDENGNKYILTDQVLERIDYPNIPLESGNYEVYIESFNNVYMFVRLMVQNMYTSQFATRVELNSAISQTASEINLEVSKKVGNDEVISRINQTAEAITIDANKIDINGVATFANAKLAQAGTTTINGGNVTTGTIDASRVNVTNINANNISSGSIDASRINVTNINANNITGGSITADKINGGTISASAINLGDGTFTVGTNGSLNANNVNISGNINATSGTFNGTVNASSGTFRGTVYASNGSFSGAVNASSGSFNGKITSSSGKVGGWTIASNKLYGTSSGTQYSIRPYGVANETKGTEQSWGRIMTAASDKNLKHEIKEIENKYDEFYDNLKPVTFYYDEGVLDEKKHIGFIAQDILENQKNINEDLSMVEKNSNSQYYNLYKEEIIGLNTWQIQKLKNKVNEQQIIIDKLEERISKLESQKEE